MFDSWLVYDKFIIAVLGWAYGYYLSNRSSRRSEVSRLKDRLVDKLDKTLSWYVDEVSDTAMTPVELEQVLADKVSQCELRINQFNKYVGVEIIDSSILATIRDIDVSCCIADKRAPASIYTLFANTIESIECSYDEHYINLSLQKRLWLEYGPELKGVFMAGVTLLVYISVFKLIF